MLTRTEWSYEFNAKEDGDIVNDAVFRRNRAIEERFNVYRCHSKCDAGG